MSLNQDFVSINCICTLYGVEEPMMQLLIKCPVKYEEGIIRGWDEDDVIMSNFVDKSYQVQG